MSHGSIEPVQVHLVADSTARPHPRLRQVRSAYGTFLLTAGINAVQILPPSDMAREAVLLAVDTAIVIASDLQAAAGGYGTYIPQNFQWVIKDEGAVFAGAVPALTGTTTSRVSVSAIYGTYDDPGRGPA